MGTDSSTSIASATPGARSSVTLRRVAAWTALAIVVFGVTYFLAMGDRADLVDETWMLWVTRRLTSGDRLYADTYFVSTPLSAWLSAGFALVGGVQLAVLRALEVTVFVIEFLVALSIARWCRLAWSSVLLFAGALFAIGAPSSEWVSVYSSVAVLFALIALRVLLVWLDHRDFPEGAATRAWALVGVGAACGLSFASKPNIGILALVAAAASIWLNRPAQHVMRALTFVVGAFGAVIVLMLVPIAADGAWSAFVSQVFGEKGDYLRVGSSYFTIVHNQLDVLVSAVTDGERPLSILHAGVVLLPIVIIVVVVWAFARTRGEGRPVVALFGIFTAAALLSMLPRPGSNHFAAVAPLAFSATLGAVATSTRGGAVSRRVHHVVYAVTGVLALAAFAVVTVHAVSGYSDPLVTRSGFAHLDGVPVPKRFRAGLEDIRTFVRDHTDGKVFILREDAGFWYLTTGAENPLPFDIPEVSDFGADGEPGVISRLARGEATWVCVKPVPEVGNGVLEPRRIRHWVRTHFDYVATIRQCDMYRRPDSIVQSG